MAGPIFLIAGRDIPGRFLGAEGLANQRVRMGVDDGLRAFSARYTSEQYRAEQVEALRQQVRRLEEEVRRMGRAPRDARRNVRHMPAVRSRARFVVRITMTSRHFSTRGHEARSSYPGGRRGMSH